MKKKFYLNQSLQVCILLMLLFTSRSYSECGIVGQNTICQGNSAQLCAFSSGAGNYLWSTGQTTSCIDVNVAGSYSVTVNGCTASFTVAVRNPPNCSISGDGNICQGQGTLLCAAEGAGYSYRWSTGATTTCINANEAGTYSLTVTDADGCSSACNKPVTVNNIPSCSISGQGSICAPDTAVLCAPNGNSLLYIWSTGATTQCIGVEQPGTYSVVVTNSGGCSSLCNKSVTVNESSTSETKVAACNSFTWHHKIYTKSGTYLFNASLNKAGCDSTAFLILSISKNPPAEPGAIEGSTRICPFVAGFTYSIAAVAGATSYVWTVPAHVSIVSGQGSTSIQCDFTNAASGNITVKAVNGCGSSASRKLAVVASTSFCTRLMQEASAVSETNTVVYPNPASGLLTVKFNHNGKANYVINIFDMTGRMMKSEEGNAVEGINLHELDLSALAKGTYMISLEMSGEEKQIIRVMLQ